jgi:hypothetical protein
MKTITTAMILSLSALLVSVCPADDKARQVSRAERTLKKLEVHITTVSTETLLQMLYSDVNSDIANPAGSMYYVMRDGNDLIKKELSKRVDKDKAVLEKHLKDKRVLFTGYNGPHQTVGQVCSTLLNGEPTKTTRLMDLISE